jgi:flagellar hook-basal body complex protein FliE
MDIKSIPAGLIAPAPVGADKAVGPGPLGQGEVGPGFADTLKAALEDANTKVQEADRQVEALVVGEGSLHRTMIAMQDASVAMDMVMAVRNKALEAYQEVMRMPV